MEWVAKKFNKEKIESITGLNIKELINCDDKWLQKVNPIQQILVVDEKNLKYD